MSEITFEFNGTQVPNEFQSEVKSLFFDEINIKVRKVQNVSGLETLIISIIGRVAGSYVEKLIEYLRSHKLSQDVKVTSSITGKTYKMPEDLDNYKADIDG